MIEHHLHIIRATFQIKGREEDDGDMVGLVQLDGVRAILIVRVRTWITRRRNHSGVARIIRLTAIYASLALFEIIRGVDYQS